MNTEQIVLYHNPRCSKSRKALELLREHAVEPQVIDYTRTPPDGDTLKQIAAALGDEAAGIIRRNEKQFQELSPAPSSLEQCLEVLGEHPALLQRPIAVKGAKAVIGRPPERVLELIAL